ncbi:hypothetical protein ABTY96_42290 [Streptomyces sp. NPDC096057]|uniref:hypothetical protein n=1 Tax=Streptomyces sp. NPDC096057 TaxID=3155543 RepID=UPI0033198F05
MISDKFPLVGGFRELEYGSPDGPSIRAAVRMAAPRCEGDLVLAVDVSAWLRPDAPTSPGQHV